MNSEYKPIGSDSIKIYGFRFGMHRYQVEQFDHNHSGKEMNDDKDRIFKCISFWDTIYGTRIYKFYDSDFGYSIQSATYLNDYIEEDELKKMILDDVIDWKYEDTYDFKDRFITNKSDFYFGTLFKRYKEDVKLPYPECLDPYDKCPICGHKLIDDVLDPENAVDVFNYHGGSSEDGPWGYWDEIYRCPHCQKLFYIRGEC